MQKTFSVLNRTQFIGISEVGNAMLYQPGARFDNLIITANELECEDRLKLARGNAVLKVEDSVAYHYDITTELLALRGVQRWKKMRGLPRDTRDLDERRELNDPITRWLLSNA